MIHDFHPTHNLGAYDTLEKKDITKIDLFSFYSNHFKKVEQVMVLRVLMKIMAMHFSFRYCIIITTEAKEYYMLIGGFTPVKYIDPSCDDDKNVFFKDVL